MILTLDIGNTNIKTALFDGDNMVQYWRLTTSKTKSSDEYGILLANLFAHNNLDMNCVTGIIYSSVVPSINFTIEHMLTNYFGIKPLSVKSGINTGISILYDHPNELGSDRIANAVAAYELYGGPCIYIDFGTATTFGVMSEKGEFLGGAICPGLKLAAEALTDRAAKLPHFELMKPASVIGKNTVANMQSGIVYGYVGLISHLVDKMRQEMGAPDAKVIATGGLALLVADETDKIDVLDGTLTLKGLRLIYEKNAQ